ncbi:hypothetical protein BDP55DRAFT_651347 [Colletotrichum godetiae]|uniref:Uncharacterized protein n=1 Tax=Colletotrichum godetiae TaxID=1209918 RepID=A0AAJ0AST8_9PEZI|nr:uncharacterized protein BDP55DRAFT_651347 [Colletotrichum godetiae]KAK1689722.1 hypothetical protein BDP55DRAFT_651347 [Colletotrichum godetiae]
MCERQGLLRLLPSLTYGTVRRGWTCILNQVMTPVYSWSWMILIMLPSLFCCLYRKKMRAEEKQQRQPATRGRMVSPAVIVYACSSSYYRYALFVP